MKTKFKNSIGWNVHFKNPDPHRMQMGYINSGSTALQMDTQNSAFRRLWTQDIASHCDKCVGEPFFNQYYKENKYGSGSRRPKTVEIITVRGQSHALRLPKYWPPTLLSARRVCTPRLCCRGRTHSSGGEGGGGVNILEDARHSSVLYLYRILFAHNHTDPEHRF